MKTFKYLIVFVVSVFFIAGLTATSWSGAETGLAKKLPEPTIKKVKPGVFKPIYKCPSGWHLAEGSFKPDKNTTCVPNKPGSINCPSGTEPFIGDCEVGCMPLLK